MIPGIYRTKAVNEEKGKPHVVAMMFDEFFGVSVKGGALAPGVTLTFGEIAPFLLNDWEEITEEYLGELEASEV